MQKSKIKTAMVGVGYWGPNLLRNLQDHPDIDVAYICDSESQSLQKIKQKYPNAQLTTRFQDVVADAAVDLVVIATPVHTHFEMAKLALNNEKNLLITKPICETEHQCLELIQLSEKKKKLLMVDHTFVYHPAVQYLKTLVQKKSLGDLLYYHSSRMNLGLYQSDVSVIYDLVPHDLSILNELVSEDPISISVASKKAARLPQEDIAFINLNYQSDFIASIQVSWLSPCKIRQTILTGTQKMVLYDDNDVVQKIKIFDKGIDTLENTDKEQKYTHFIQYRQGDIFSPTLPTTEALKNEIEHLVDCLHTGKLPRTNGYQALRMVRLLEISDQLAKNNDCWKSLSHVQLPERSLPHLVA